MAQDFVSVTISVESAAVARAGFGVPMILSHTATWVERIKFYEAITDVVDDFATTTPEYLAATQIFSQNPHAPRIAIGRAANAVTQRFKIAVKTLANSTVYTVTVSGVDVTVTSDATATNDEVVSLLVTALNLELSGFTASAQGTVGSQYVEVLADAANNWVGLEVDTTLLTIEQDHAAPDLAADLTAIQNENGEWYALVTLYNSKAYVLAAAAWVESASIKFYLAATQETNAADVAESIATDVAKALKDLARRKTTAFYHPDNGVFADAAWLGKKLPSDPGSEVWFASTLSGVPVYTLTATQKTNLEAKFCNYYIQNGGVNIVSSKGVVAANEYIDVIRFVDWLSTRIGEDVFALIVARANANSKIPYTDAGIAAIQGVIMARLSNAVEIGGLAPVLTGSDPPVPFIVNVPRVADVLSADKIARLLQNVTFFATLAGAIQEVSIKGTLLV